MFTFIIRIDYFLVMNAVISLEKGKLYYENEIAKERMEIDEATLLKFLSYSFVSII